MVLELILRDFSKLLNDQQMNETSNTIFQSRFAIKDEIFGDKFNSINKRIIELNKEFGLTDYTEINNERFPWSKGRFESPAVYISRLWEYPFAILAAELKPDMKCADIGCGTTPFTTYLCEAAGASNVTGFDPDLIKDENDQCTAFGIKKGFVQKTGFNFFPDDMTNLHAEDESFDRVFCISVIEHITEQASWQKGLKEMFRVLKPGGRLIMTVDLGINRPLTNPLDLVKYSGLSPMSTLDLRWPAERFIHLDEQGMDVFGLVLEKSTTQIFIDTKKNTTIPEFEAHKKFTPGIISSSASQLAKDYERPYGSLRVIAKILTGRYS